MGADFSLKNSKEQLYKDWKFPPLDGLLAPPKMYIWFPLMQAEWAYRLGGAGSTASVPVGVLLLKGEVRTIH